MNATATPFLGIYMPQKPPTNIHNSNNNNHTNITHFHNDKILRHQGHEVKRFIESKNQFEDPSGACLYDDIINKIAFGGQPNGNAPHRVYINGNGNGNGVEKSSSFEALKRQQQNHLRGITFKSGINSSPKSPQNVTITTRINNGKLESEV